MNYFPENYSADCKGSFLIIPSGISNTVTGNQSGIVYWQGCEVSVFPIEDLVRYAWSRWFQSIMDDFDSLVLFIYWQNKISWVYRRLAQKKLKFILCLFFIIFVNILICLKKKVNLYEIITPKCLFHLYSTD